MIPTSPRRVSPRLLGFDYSQEGAYFVTIAVKGRQYLFGDIVDNEMNLNEFGKIVGASWDDLSCHFHPALNLDAFRVMPNHVPGIIIITREKGFGFPLGSSIETGGETPPLQKPPALGEILGYYKYQSAVRINALRNSVGTSIWQRGYYEHVIRDDRSLNRIRNISPAIRSVGAWIGKIPGLGAKMVLIPGWHRSRGGPARLRKKIKVKVKLTKGNGHGHPEPGS